LTWICIVICFRSFFFMWWYSFTLWTLWLRSGDWRVQMQAVPELQSKRFKECQAGCWFHLSLSIHMGDLMGGILQNYWFWWGKWWCIRAFLWCPIFRQGIWWNLGDCHWPNPAMLGKEQHSRLTEPFSAGFQAILQYLKSSRWVCNPLIPYSKWNFRSRLWEDYVVAWLPWFFWERLTLVMDHEATLTIMDEALDPSWCS